VVTWQLEHRPHPEQGYRACLGMQRLARQYTPIRLEAACTRALSIRSPNLRSVTSILKSGLDRPHGMAGGDSQRDVLRRAYLQLHGKRSIDCVP